MANFDLHKLMEAKNPQAVMLEETRGLKSKWQTTGLLEGLKERDQHAMSVLLENQAKQLLDEATSTGTAPASEEWSGVALPLVRRIFGEIASKEFVSVQPMNLPSGLIFYLDFKYGSDQKGNPGFLGSSVFGGTGKKLGSTDSAVSGAYGDGRWGYSIRQVTSSGSVGEEVDLSADEIYAYVGFNSELSSSIADGEIFVVEYDIDDVEDNAPGSRMQKLLDREGARSFVLEGDTITNFFPQYTVAYKSDDPTLTSADPADKIRFVVQADTAGDAEGTVELTYSIQPKDFDRGDFEDRDPVRGENDGEGYDAGSDLQIPEIDLELRSEPIVAKTRKLKAVWTPELAQDLNAYHSIDAEAELTSMLSEYISLEIDLEILDMLKSNALTVDYWSANIGEEFNSVQGSWTLGADTAARYQKNTWYQTLGIKMNKVSNKIHTLTLRGGANFVVASPDVCTILESIPGFHVNADKDAMEFAAGVTAVGAIANRYTVYKNPYMTSNEILMGYKGNNFLETGAVYSPYVPLIMTPLVYDPTNFTPRRGVMTRYAKKIVRPEFYGKIYVKDLQNV